MSFDHTAKRLVAIQHSHFPNREDATAIRLAIVWWLLQMGALVFDKPLCQGLSIARRDQHRVHRTASETLARLLRAVPDHLPQRDIANDNAPESPVGKATGRKASEARLVHATIELLQERPATGVSGRELARRANVYYGLIHHYFGPKEVVFGTVFVALH